MPPRPIGDRPMTGAQRMARSRARVLAAVEAMLAALELLCNLDPADAHSDEVARRQALGREAIAKGRAVASAGSTGARRGARTAPR